MHPPVQPRWRIDYIIQESYCTLFLPGQAKRHRRRFRAFERFQRRFFYGRPIDKFINFLKFNHLSGFFRFKIGGCALRLYRYDFCIRRDVFHVRAEPGQESSSPTLAKRKCGSTSMSFKISMAAVPCPAMTSGSSNG